MTQIALEPVNRVRLTILMDNVTDPLVPALRDSAAQLPSQVAAEGRVPDALVGGFHLSGPMFEAIIPATVRAFDELAPSLLIPAHCTGWKAVHQLAARFPDAFVQSAVGTTIEL